MFLLGSGPNKENDDPARDAMPKLESPSNEPMRALPVYSSSPPAPLRLMSFNVTRQPISSRPLSSTFASPFKMQEIFSSAQGSILATLPARDGQRSPDMILAVRCRSPNFERYRDPAVIELTRSEHDNGGHHHADLARPLLHLATKDLPEVSQHYEKDRAKNVYATSGRGWKPLDTDPEPTEDASSDSWSDDEIFCVRRPNTNSYIEPRQPPSDRSSHASRVNAEYFPVSPDLTSPYQQDHRNWNCQPRVQTQPRWELQANAQPSKLKTRSRRFKSYYHGSISVRQVPGEYGPLSPIMVMHSNSSSSSTSRKTSVESCTGMSAHVDTEPMKSILESPEKAVVQADSTRNASTGPGEETTPSLSVLLHSPKHPFKSGSNLSSTVPSQRSSLSGSPAAPWSPVSPHFQDSPRQHAALQEVQHTRSSISEEQYLDEAHVPLLATHFRDEGSEKSAASLAFRPVTPMAREGSYGMDGIDARDNRELTPLSPNVKIERGSWQHRDANMASRSVRADSGYENGASWSRKRCGSDLKDEVLERMGASPGKKRDAEYGSG